MTTDTAPGGEQAALPSPLKYVQRTALNMVFVLCLAAVSGHILGGSSDGDLLIRALSTTTAANYLLALYAVYALQQAVDLVVGTQFYNQWERLWSPCRHIIWATVLIPATTPRGSALQLAFAAFS